MNRAEKYAGGRRRSYRGVTLALFVIALIILLISGCPVYTLTGIPCPCCGVTRAWLAFLQGNARLAFEYHMLFPVIPLIAGLYLVRERLSPIWRCRADALQYILALAVFVYGCLRWCGIVVMP